MAEGENNFSEDYADLQTPAEASPESQGRIAADMQADIHKADIVVDKPKTPAGAQQELPENDQSRVAAEHSARTQQIQQSIKAEAGAAGAKNEIKGDLIPPGFARILEKLPGIGAVMRQLKTKDINRRIKIILRFRKMLKTAKTGASMVDGITNWAKVFAVTLETIIIPILLIFLLLPWLAAYAILQEKMPGARITKTIAKVLSAVDKSVPALQKAAQNEQGKKSAMARLNALRNQQIKNRPAANEPMAGQKAA